MNKKRNIVLYTISFIVLCCYLTVAYLTFKPNVSDEYKLYYIQNKITDWPGDGGFDIGVNNKKFFGSEYQMSERFRAKGQGWISEDSNGLWTDNYGELYFKVDKSKDVSIELEVLAENNDRNSNIEILLNGDIIQEIALVDNNVENINVKLNKELLKEDYNVLTLKIKDNEEFKLAIQSVEFLNNN